MTEPEVMFAALETDAAAIDSFVTTENARTADAFMGARFQADVERAAAVLENPDRLSGLTRRGTWLYTFKQTGDNPRGLWLRRPESAPIDARTGWSTVFDVDAFCAADGGDWHWRGAVTAPFDPARVLIKLSQGGSDQIRTLEFDCNTGAVVPGGFDIGPERGGAAWLDADTLLWSSAVEGDATAMSWPGTVRRLTRTGGPGAAAEIFRAGPKDLGVYAYSLPTASGERIACVSRVPTIGQQEATLFFPEGAVTLPTPPDTMVAKTTTHFAYIVQEKGGSPGALMLGEVGGDAAREVWRPDARQSVSPFSIMVLRDWLVWVRQDNVQPSLWVLSLRDANALPVQIEPPEAAEMFGIGCHDAEPGLDAGTASAPLVITLTGMLRSPVTYLFDLDAGPKDVRFSKLWQEPDQFDATGKTVELREAVSDDGTRVPYHLVRPEGTAPVPTMIYGYGGFGISMQPSYNAAMGKLWLERGGAYAMTHIRGGAEFGPGWHQAAKGAGRPRAFEDFAAVARDLAGAGLAAPLQIGCHGGSNGGLLTGVMLNRYPDLFGAVWSSVGVYDMLRFHKFPAGKAWMDEYGDPDDPGAQAWLRAYSPLHTVPEATTALPPVLISTSANDDRVDPSHARRYAAALKDKGHAPWFYQHGGGHGGGGSSRARAREMALGFGFLAVNLGLD